MINDISHSCVVSQRTSHLLMIGTFEWLLVRAVWELYLRCYWDNLSWCQDLLEILAPKTKWNFFLYPVWTSFQMMYALVIWGLPSHNPSTVVQASTTESDLAEDRWFRLFIPMKCTLVKYRKKCIDFLCEDSVWPLYVVTNEISLLE